MSGKLSTVVIIFGCACILLGLSFLPAAFSRDHDQTILGAAICAVSFGFLSVAAGFYLKNRLLQSAAVSGPNKTQRKAVRGGCDLCGTESPVIHCRVHQLHICGDCVSQHYDFRSCVYIPSTRRPNATKPQARSARAGKT